jgi:hypothetical protein
LLRFLAAVIELADDHFADWLWRGFHQLYTMRAASGRALNTRAVLHEQPGMERGLSLPLACDLAPLFIFT